MDERGRELLGQIETQVAQVLETIHKLRSESQNEADEDQFLKVLELDVTGVQEAWQRLVEHRRPIPERPPHGPFDPPEN